MAIKHGPSKPRDWCKVHLGIAADTLEIRAIEVTGSRVGDAPVRPDLLDQIPDDQPLGIVTADGADDARACHAAIAARGAGFHRRSLPEARMRCLKLLGERVLCRDFGRQVAELQIRTAILNRFTALGTPLTQRTE